MTITQIKDIVNNLTDMECQKIVLVNKGVAWCGFSDTDRMNKMGLLDKDNIRLTFDGRRVFDYFPHHKRY